MKRIMQRPVARVVGTVVAFALIVFAIVAPIQREAAHQVQAARATAKIDKLTETQQRLAAGYEALRAQLEACAAQLESECDPTAPPADDIVDTPLPPTIIRETVPEAVLAAMVRDALEQLTDEAPDVDALVSEAVAAYCAEDACKGQDGTSVSVDDVAPIVVQAVADYCGTGACTGPAGPQGEQGPAGPACDDCVTEDEARAIALTVVQQWAVGTPVYCPRWPDDNEQQVLTCWIGNWP